MKHDTRPAHFTRATAHSGPGSDAAAHRPALSLGLASLAVAAALALAACATTPPPTAQLAVASASVAQAAAAGAAEFSPAELTSARDKLRRANQAVVDKDNDSALRLAQQAQIDAQVAVARTDNAKARKATLALQESDRALREEMARQPR